MNSKIESIGPRRLNRLTTVRSLIVPIVAALLLLGVAPTAQASKQPVDFFGEQGTLGGQLSSPEGVAVNYSGAGGVPAGTVYVTDGGSLDFPSERGNRVERFVREDNGTPGETADDTYSFVAAWGAGVLTGGTDYEICTEAASCQKGTGLGGNGTLAGDGSLNKPSGIAIDQDTGNVYVIDGGSRRTPDNHFRVNVYSATGTFLRSFGWDVVEAGPGNTGTGYEVCVGTNGDVCKKGTSGAGIGQFGVAASGERAPESIAASPPDGNPSTGTLYLADQFNGRVNTYDLDGTSPGSIGSAAQFDTSQPTDVAIDSRGILYAANHEDNGPDSSDDTYPIERYDTENANGGGTGFLAPIEQGVDERQAVTVSATAGSFRLSFDIDGAGPQPAETTVDIPYDTLDQSSAGFSLTSALRDLPSIGRFGIELVAGGPGDATGSSPYKVTFSGGLGAKDVPQLTCSDGPVPLSGGSGCSVTTTTPGQDGLSRFPQSLAVDPDEDGPGPDADVLYAAREGVIQQFGPLNAPGLTVPPTDDDDRHATNGVIGSGPIAVEPSTGRLYTATFSGPLGPGVYVLDETGPPPTASVDSADGITPTSADLHATIDPNGRPATLYHFEYVDDATFGESGFTEAKSTPETFLGIQDDPQAIVYHLEPAPIGLEPNTTYHVRVVAARKFAPPVIGSSLAFTTAGSPPLAETAGAPVRSTTTAQLNGRVTPLATATTYHFEYGTEGPCDANPCVSTPAMPAGSGHASELAAEEITELQPDTTYHYRLVAENGIGSPAVGDDMTVRTRASNQLPNQSDEFPGPPGSDRAWEQVSIGDSSGNPVSFLYADIFSDDGNRAVYGIAGGTPISSTGSLLSLYFAQRTAGGWQSERVTPPREQLAGQVWSPAIGSDELSTMIAENTGTDSGIKETEVWQLTPGAGPNLLRRAPGGGELHLGISADGSRILAILEGGLDPAYPAASARLNVYDVGSAAPQLISLLPGNVISPCGVSTVYAMGTQHSNWVSPDGSLAYFESDPAGPCTDAGAGTQLYVRDLTTDQTKLLSGPPLSGPDCAGSLIKATPGAAFFATSSRLDPADLEPTACPSSEGAKPFNDVYRYDTGSGSLTCVTCLGQIPGFELGLDGTSAARVAISEDGSRVYFTTEKRLLHDAQAEGQQAEGQTGLYRIDVQSGALAYVAPIGNKVGTVEVGTAQNSVAFSDDGSTLVFASASAALDPLGGTTNGGTVQYYRYDDNDRSLVCVSCPQDGSPPRAKVQSAFHLITATDLNNSPLSGDGSTFAFITPTPLAGADQNTPGPDHTPDTGADAYEWRDGRLILLSDGLTNWSETKGLSGEAIVLAPQVAGVSPSGADVYFTATAQYTPDAPDALMRLYDARIGGGISFPKPPPPCPLEVCQGTPKGAPEEQEPASRNFAGLGNQTEPKASRCPKGRRKVRQGGKTRCVKPRKHPPRAASHNRRAHR
jgi:hypothetical protein